jgi:tetratricopeptide (TPR) repeat protein
LNTQSYLQQVKAALTADDVPTAVSIAAEAVAAGVEDGLLLNLAAYGLQVQRRYAESMALLTRASSLTPRDPLIHNAIGQLLSQQGRNREAAAAFEKALSLDPMLATAHNGLGQLFEGIGEYDRARAHLEKAARIAPDFADPLGSLAALALQRKDTAAARELAERALSLDPSLPAAAICLATLELDAGELDGAEQRLRRLLAQQSLAPLHEASAWKLLGDVLHARHRSDEAFDAYVAGNRLFRTIFDSQLADMESGVDLTERLAGYFATTAIESWRVPDGSRAYGAPTRHVFMVGFFRSGTTLLEQVLASHPTVRTLEEKQTLDEAAAEFFGGDDEALDRLANLSESRARELREAYWRKVRSHGVEPEDLVFVDKLPISTLWIPLIIKLFPEASILFVRRDPRDVVLSCFRHRFHATPLMHEFTDIVRAAKFYSGAMTVFEIYQERLAPALRICRHEDLIDHFDDEVRQICAFLQIPWNEAMRDFVSTAKGRDIRTPSAPQVIRGLNADGVGQWRAYADAMPQALEILRPWVEKYEYPRS